MSNIGNSPLFVRLHQFEIFVKRAHGVGGGNDEPFPAVQKTAFDQEAFRKRGDPVPGRFADGRGFFALMLPGKKVGIQLRLGDEIGDATERIMLHRSGQGKFPQAVGQDSLVDLILGKAGVQAVKEPDMPVRIPAAAPNPFAVVIIVHANGINGRFIQSQRPDFPNEFGRHHLIAVQ